MLRNFIASGVLALSATAADAVVLSFDNTDFLMAPEFKRLRNFSFWIDIDAVLIAGQTYSNPVLNSVDCTVFGILESEQTLSGFPAFDLPRLGASGSEFYG